MQLTLIRHGITQGNRDRLYYGSTDLPLLPEGVAELEALRATGTYPKPQLFFTSGMLRTEQTLAALYGNVPHEVLRGLRELDFGAFEMKTYEQLKDDPDYQIWCTGNVEDNVCPGGESGTQVLRRSLAALEPVLSRNQDAVCITHGGIIGGVLAHWFPEGTRFDWTPKPGHGFIVTVIDGVPKKAAPIL